MGQILSYLFPFAYTSEISCLRKERPPELCSIISSHLGRRAYGQPDILRLMVGSTLYCFLASYLTPSQIDRVKRGITAQNPEKYVLDDKELERVSALARIELEDAKKELERAHKAAGAMGKGAEGEEADDADEDDEDESAWVE